MVEQRELRVMRDSAGASEPVETSECVAELIADVDAWSSQRDQWQALVSEGAVQSP